MQTLGLGSHLTAIRGLGSILKNIKDGQEDAGVQVGNNRFLVEVFL